MQNVVAGLMALAVAGAVFATAPTFALRASADKQTPGPTSQAPSPTPQAPGLSTRYLKVRLGPTDLSGSPGERLTLTLDVTPGPKMHVYAPGQDDYIPISLALEASKDFKTEPAKFPDAQPLFLAPINMTARVYNKPFQIAQTVTLAATPALRQRAGAKDTLTINGTLKYQACDDLVCYRPDMLPVSWKVALSPGR